MGDEIPTPGFLDVGLDLITNSSRHKTDRFDAAKTRLVLRRGFAFQLDLTFDSDFDLKNTVLLAVFRTGSQPKPSNGSLIMVQVSDRRLRKADEWQAWITPDQGRKITIHLLPAPDAIVGLWNLDFRMFPRKDIGRRKVDLQIYRVNGIYILFNPWCPEDDVYVKDFTKLEEYILNDVGKIWRGGHTSFRGMVWSYGQFEPGILEASMAILDRSPRLGLMKRRSPIFVSRDVSAMVNSNDRDGGVIVGNWSGDYADGTSPTDWQGSVQILSQWFSSKNSVRYGQCWVFAGVLTTVLRALGIPCRAITNFDSAHDTDATITYDIHVDTDGDRVENLSNDSVWNFHVWNEAWMARPDLPRGYGGWQVVDSTPQERSDSIFQAGPASVVAVRKGEVGLKYDTAFVFAEVNADKVTWLYSGPDEPVEVINKETDVIGKFLSTKKVGPILPGNADRRDMTIKYKPPEMSKEERLSVMNAVNNGLSPARSIYTVSESRDVRAQVEPIKTTMIGRDVDLQIKVANESDEDRNVDVLIRIDSMFYTGTLHKLVKRDMLSFELKPKEERVIDILLKASEYVNKLIDQASLLASVLLRVHQTGQISHAEDHFRVRLPAITIEVSTELQLGKPTMVKAFFTNPLPKTLTNCKFILEGPGLEAPTEIPISNVSARGQAEAELEITPRRSGHLVLLASFCSDTLTDIDGSMAVHVQP